MKTTLLAAVIAGLAGSAAIAGSPDTYIEYDYVDPPVLDATWAGFYGGIIGGIQSGEVSPIALTFDATNYGVFGGYNVQKDKLVFGIEVAGQVGTLKVPAPLDIDMLIDAKARVGYSFGDALVFASGGYTTFGSTALGIGAKGWNAGAGVDYAVTDRFFLGGEYVYRDLGTSVPAGFGVTSHGGQLRAGFRF